MVSLGRALVSRPRSKNFFIKSVSSSDQLADNLSLFGDPRIHFICNKLEACDLHVPVSERMLDSMEEYNFFSDVYIFFYFYSSHIRSFFSFLIYAVSNIKDCILCIYAFDHIERLLKQLSAHCMFCLEIAHGSYCIIGFI